MMMLFISLCFATSFAEEDDCVYPVATVDFKCYDSKVLIAGTTSPSQCYAAAKSDTACYKGADARGRFFFNSRTSSNCRCPTDNCSGKQTEPGSYIYNAMCGDDVNNFDYSDLGVGKCVRTVADGWRGTRPRYSYLSSVSQAECKTTCDYEEQCQGYAFNPGNDGFCLFYKDHIKLKGQGGEFQGVRCFLKKFWEAAEGAGQRQYIKMNGVIVGVKNNASETQTLTFEALSTHIVTGFAFIGVLAIAFKLYDGCNKYYSAYESVLEHQEI